VPREARSAKKQIEKRKENKHLLINKLVSLKERNKDEEKEFWAKREILSAPSTMLVTCVP